MFQVIGYGRASTDHQVLSTDKQCDKVLAAFEAYKVIKRDWQDAVWGGFERDEATCRQSKFRERPAGSLLLARLRPGDVMLVSDYDRLFCGIVDVCETLELFRELGAQLIILDSDFDTTTNMGDFAFKVIGLVKEMEVRELRKRTKESLDHRRSLGLPYSGKTPLGWKIIRYRLPGDTRIYKALVPNHAVRALANKLLQLRQRRFGTYIDMTFYCNHPKHGLRCLNGNDWSKDRIRLWVIAAQKNFRLPNGSLEAFPIPANAVPCQYDTITPCDA